MLTRKRTPEDLRQRKGKVLIDEDTINRHPEDVMEILSHMVVVRAEFEFIYHGISYHGYSHLFEAIPNGEITPEYDITITRNWCGKITSINAIRR